MYRCVYLCFKAGFIWSYDNCQAAVTEEERERLLAGLQEKALSLERRLEANLSQDEHLQELLKEVRTLCT